MEDRERECHSLLEKEKSKAGNGTGETEEYRIFQW